jgi:hypothetical protein
MESLFRDSDRITIAHIFNHNKDYLPFDMKPDALKKTYETLTLPLGLRAALWWDEADSKYTTKEQMSMLAVKAGASMIVVGMHGRKGPKA